MLTVSAFDPFGGSHENPSERVLQAFLASTELPVRGVVLPTVFDDSVAILNQHVEEMSPSGLIMLGVAEDRAVISLERVALNVRDARIPDNAGLQPRHQTIIEEGPLALASGLDLEAMARALIEVGVPVEFSYHAGTFVCNHLFYSMRHGWGDTLPVGFIHVPPIDSSGWRGLPLDVQVLALASIVEVQMKVG